MGQNGSKFPLARLVLDAKSKPNRKLSRRHHLVAELAARGHATSLIAQETGLTPKRIRQILRIEEVNAEIYKITAEIFSEGDRHLANLYQKSLVKLDEHLDSPNLEIQDKAIEKVLRFFQPKGEVKAKPLIAQFFSGMQQEDQVGNRLDRIILEKRRQRGLPDFPAEEDL
jgi:hypothetical protein